MKYWVIISLACLASASDLQRGEKDISYSSSSEELGSRFGSSGIGESLLKTFNKMSHSGHENHPFQFAESTGSKNKGNLMDILKFDVNHGRDYKREYNEILDLLKMIAFFGGDSLGREDDFLKSLFGLNKGGVVQKGQRGMDSDFNFDKILKQGTNLQQGSQTSNLGNNFEDILREIFGGGNSGSNSGGRSVNNGGGRGFNSGGNRDVNSGGGWGVNNGAGRGIGNSGGRDLGSSGGRDIGSSGGRDIGSSGGRDIGSSGGRGIGSGGGKGIRDGDLFTDGGFGGSKSGDGRSKSGDNIDGKNFNNEDDLFLFS